MIVQIDMRERVDGNAWFRVTAEAQPVLCVMNRWALNYYLEKNLKLSSDQQLAVIAELEMKHTVTMSVGIAA
jgi:hypothetical protein